MLKKNQFAVLFFVILSIIMLSVFKNCTHSIEALKLSDMPTQRQEIAAAELNNEFYAIGGIGSSMDDSDAVEAYNPNTDKWRESSPLPRKLHHVASTKFGNKIYAMGGFFTDKGRFIAVSDVYEFDGSRWLNKTPMPTARGGLGLAVYEDKIYAIGGEDNFSSLTTVEVYYPLKDKWMNSSPINFPKDHVAVVELKGKIYVFGGRNNYCYMNHKSCLPYQNYKHVEVYSPEKNKWTIGKPMINPRSGTVVATLNGKIYIFGGENHRQVFPDFEQYDPNSLNMSVLMNVNLVPRHGAGIIAHGNKIYIFGGGIKPGFGPTNTTEVVIFNSD